MLLNSFILVCFLTSIISVVFGIFVCKKGSPSVNKLWLLMSLSVALWSFGLGRMVDAESKVEALFFLRYFHYLGATLIPAFYLHFVLALLGEAIRKKTLITSIYVFSFAMLFFNFQGTLASVRPEVLIFSYYTKPETFYLLYTIVFFAVILYTLYLIGINYFSSFGRKKHQLQYQLFATLVGFGGGGTAFLPVFFPHIFPFGMYFMFSYILLMAYAITRYRLMDIKVVAIRTLTFSLVYVPILVVPFFIGYRLAEGVASVWVVPVLISTFFAPTGLFIYLVLQKKAEQQVNVRKIKYLNAIYDFLENVKEVRTIDELVRLILDGVIKRLGVEYTALYLMDKDSGHFILKEAKSTRGVKETCATKDIKGMDALIRYLKQNGAPVIAEEVKYQRTREETDFLREIEAQLFQLNAIAVIPSFYQKELLAFIVLGEQKNGKHLRART